MQHLSAAVQDVQCHQNTIQITVIHIFIDYRKVNSHAFTAYIG